jgi:hypothetical protein
VLHRPVELARLIGMWPNSRSQDSEVCITATNVRRNCFEDHQSRSLDPIDPKGTPLKIQTARPSRLADTHAPEKPLSKDHLTGVELFQGGWNYGEAQGHSAISLACRGVASCTPPQKLSLRSLLWTRYWVSFNFPWSSNNPSWRPNCLRARGVM